MDDVERKNKPADSLSRHTFSWNEWREHVDVNYQLYQAFKQEQAKGTQLNEAELDMFKAAKVIVMRYERNGRKKT